MVNDEEDDMNLLWLIFPLNFYVARDTQNSTHSLTI